ncbi:DUF883 family protein [Pedosphaera parvula]|uniref:DUF883 family protein n=1 Tax=Pedosphaera parvula TaxID=1032527 RepID=UPI0001735635|nr:DUF883 family protein [Pedosphaera parvula]
MNTNLKDTAEDIKSKASDRYQNLQRKASEKFQNVQKKVTDTAKNVSGVTDTYVHDNPWKSVAMVALAACIFGFLIGNARHSD